jgi:hypothetical protein
VLVDDRFLLCLKIKDQGAAKSWSGLAYVAAEVSGPARTRSDW